MMCRCQGPNPTQEILPKKTQENPNPTQENFPGEMQPQGKRADTPFFFRRPLWLFPWPLQDAPLL